MDSSVKQYNTRFILLMFVVLSFDRVLSEELHRSLNDTVAIIGNRIITVGKFTESYKSKLIKLGLTDNVDTRLGYLNNLVNDEIFIAYSKQDKLDKTKEAKKEFSLIEQQELLNEYTQKHIIDTVKVSEDDLKEFFIMLNTKIKVRHLFAPTKEKAELLFAELKNGKTFSKLAKQVFADPVLRDNGGLLGYIEVDEMDADFEKAAFGLKIDEISKPVKTVQGYSIIQVEDIKRNPFVTEYEYARSKDRLRAFVQKRKFEDAAKNYTAQMHADLNIRINNALLSRLYGMSQQSSWQHIIEQPTKMLTSNDLSKIIVETKAWKWSVRKLIDVLSGTNERQRKWIHTEENFYDYVSGLVLRTYITEQARKENLYRTESFRSSVEYKFDTYLSGALEKLLKKKIMITEDSVKTYYQQNKDKFSNPARIRLSSLLLDDKQKADSLQQLLRNGESFDQLAKQFSVQTITAERGGDIGFFRKDELGTYGEEIFSLRKGEWKGPLLDDGKFLFVKCTDLTNITYKSFEESKEEIKAIHIDQMWHSTQTQYVEQFKKSIICRIYPERVMTMIISLNNN